MSLIECLACLDSGSCETMEAPHHEQLSMTVTLCVATLCPLLYHQPPCPKENMNYCYSVVYLFVLNETLIRARINEENFSNRIDTNRLFLNRLELSYDWSLNESTRRRFCKLGRGK